MAPKFWSLENLIWVILSGIIANFYWSDDKWLQRIAVGMIMYGVLLANARLIALLPK